MTTKRFAAVGPSLLVILLLGVAIYAWSSATKDNQSSRPDGLRGGHIIAMPGVDGFQFEFTVDSRTRRMVLYSQEAGTREPYALATDHVDAEFGANGEIYDATFNADPQSDDPEGRSSRFVLSLDKVPQQLAASHDYTLTLSFSSDGGVVSGKMSHHDDHSHQFDHD
ncbi:MAG: hypothetical protein AAF802_24990 [Planctomycetota bacterium]